MDYASLINDYLAGPRMLRQAVAGMTREELDGLLQHDAGVLW
jgi:hypothetical protein